MIDDVEKTPVIFIVLNDQHLSQILSNIMQVKDRGATTIVLTTLEDIKDHIEMTKIDFLIQLEPNNSILAALQAVTPLQMICYYTALARGMNPDKQMFDAIDFLE
jgi:glucosamine--fructose-6-phosphate aminotransferase (isomerizing)